jgi:RimJ/RimL family protein N-acetyltransferase
MLRSRILPSDNPSMENYAVLLKPTGTSGNSNDTTKPRMIGVVGTPRWTVTETEVGYGIHPDYWVKGYATEAMGLFIKIYWDPDRRRFPIGSVFFHED